MSRARTIFRQIWPAVALIGAFLILQVFTLDYGTRINDLAFIRDHRVTSNVVEHSGLTRNQLVGAKTTNRESLDLWMVRFKLYSINADEVLNIIALARIKPSQLQFDPGLYQYGGAYLYPLGAWYFALSKLNIIHVGPFQQMLKYPQRMDRAWIAGRAFILTAFAVSALLLFLALCDIAPRAAALAALAIYLFCPATIMFSQTIKPHWYALLWVNAAVLVLTRAVVRHRLSLCAELLLAAFLGLAVGSAMTFAVFAALVWGVLAWLVAQKTIAPATLLRVPIFAILIFVALNPYYILDWHAAQTERAMAADWFHPAFNLNVLTTFTYTSLFAGFGIVFTIVAGAIAFWRLIVGPLPARLFAIAMFASVCIIAGLTANLDTWTVNFRYVSYEIPVALIFLAAWSWRFRTPVLVLCAIATAVQAVPLKLAYFDENSPTHSTRFAAAAWVDAHIPKSEAICLTTKELAPFEVPPFRFDQHRINSPDCRWLIRVERYPASVRTEPGLAVAKRFAPRLSPQRFPLVWGHINPQITIYRKNG